MPAESSSSTLGRLKESMEMVPESERENLVVIALKTGVFVNEEEIRQEFDVKDYR
ncbi:MAG: hypothetical protein Q9N34_09345 [Aquificota bacterium]|nr:hypothetical protein [Aquificota bacterium]